MQASLREGPKIDGKRTGDKVLETLGSIVTDCRAPFCTPKKGTGFTSCLRLLSSDGLASARTDGVAVRADKIAPLEFCQESRTIRAPQEDGNASGL